ncbi:hypothetical protein [Neptuniibacter sp.]|uniref:hypothetical protein n=1 Tax=Neptuniibacter sp. TaxID=1962643 RepID=UPI002620AE59|nr:hypothetical protein [Neptuniibacter sp.]MCP4598312.1 hypothetical protein [Neptuniibacter sp.]
MTVNADFLTAMPENAGLTALEAFLGELCRKKDVYIVTMSQLVQWMRKPTSLSEIGQFPPFQCPKAGSALARRPPCGTNYICNFKTPDLISGEHQIRSCQPCPKQYPWVHNPAGI